MQFTPFKIETFDGGITDNPVDNDINKYEEGDNLLVNYNKKLTLRPGSTFWDATLPQIPAGAQRLGMITEHEDVLLFHSAKKLYYRNLAAWVTLVGPVTANDVLTTGTVTNLVSWDTWNKQLLITNDSLVAPVCKIYNDGAGVKQVRTAGMPPLATAPTVTAGAAGANSYIYSFCYYFTYTVGTVVFEDFGPVTSVTLTNAAAPNTNAVAIAAIPVLANGVNYNYDTVNIRVKIYRTQNGGTVRTYIGDVANGTAVYNDNAADTAIVNNAQLYTTGGVLDNDPPPLCKFITVCNGYAYYGHIKRGTITYGSYVVQSIRNDPDSVPQSAIINIGTDVTAVSSYQDRPLIFSKDGHYRVEGVYDELGNGTVSTTFVAPYGTESPNSIVRTAYGTFFASKDGFYVTDGFNSYRISEEFLDSYAAITDSATKLKRLYGAYDVSNHRIWWSAQEASGAGADVDTSYILDLRHGVKEDSCFTTASNGTSWAPTAIYFYNGNLIRGDSRGYIFQHSNTRYSDPRVDIAVATTLWGTKAIIYDFLSVAHSFGNAMKRKFIPRCTVVAKNETNLALQIVSNTDLGRKQTNLAPIIFRANLVWGDPLFVWGDPYFQWGTGGIIEAQRRFGGQDMRCSYKQLQLTNAYIILSNSDSLCTATVDDAAKTATLTNPATYDWPTDILDYYISFEADDYHNEFLITNRAANVVTFADPLGLSIDGIYKWLIKGKPKGQKITILSLALEAAYMGETQQRFSSYQVGENA